MSRHIPHLLPTMQVLPALLLAAGLAACGGGGGGDAGPGSLALNTANRDLVARATVAGVYAMLSPGGLALEGAMLSSARPGALLAGVAARASQGFEARRQRLDASSRVAPAAVIGPEIQPCPWGGSLSLSLDDRDNSLSLTAGDTLTLVAANCRESETRRLNGTVVFEFTQVGTGTAETFAARAAMTAFSMQDGARSVSIDGTIGLDYARLTASTERTRATTEGTVSLRMQTAVLDDTLTLSPGFWVENLYDMSAAPPEFPFAWGRDTLTSGGQINSSRAGGSFSVSTPMALSDYEADDYPRAGVIRIEGRSGQERLTVLDAETVRVELDAGNDGVYESSDVVRWDSLI